MACLSPEELGLSVLVRNWALAASGALVAIVLLQAWRRRHYQWIPLTILALLVHPAWTTSIYAGDCGYATRFLSVAAAVLFAGIAVCQIYYPQTRVRVFVLGLSVLSWLGFGLAHLYWKIVDYTSVVSFLTNTFPSTLIESFLFASPVMFQTACATSIIAITLFVLHARRAYSAGENAGR
jgi:hypothetical protein